ncbi:protein ROOT INITIATION DEFECTIVE 3-like isoform X3 [Vitis riparia]|uniref:protein ROOT INITIATION DEFECTIVE 3-like isoform X3 n=1 Tax=Vitis riparia TaxID=96939 RepID=UPI00155ADB07|nr:protein ROOT INITIATION DEFECTIVE 3-like isoform X3 [Vitis riparia]
MREKKMDWSGGREALVVCSDRSMSVGITVWDMVSGDQLLHIPTCAASPHGLMCLREQFLVASQIHRHGSLGGGAIFIWPLNKPQSPLRNYPMEAIGPVSCSKDGVYIVGGAPSGNAYIWEVADGRLLKTWHAHHKSLTSMVFSDDDSLLISGSDDGMIRVWSMISLLDIADCGRFPSLFHSLLEHTSSITGLLSISGSSSPVLVSSSLDGTCKVWDLIRGRLLRTRVFPAAITAIVLDPGEQLLFSGSADGRIFVSMLDTGLVVDPFNVPEDRPIVLNGHNRSITALAFSRLGLVSASRDCAAHLWDVASGVIIRRFNHPKVSSARQLIHGNDHSPTFMLFPQSSPPYYWLPKHSFTKPANSRSGARMYTRSNTNETRDKYREPDVGCKNDKARHGDEQALAITFTRFDAEPVALICRLNRN